MEFDIKKIPCDGCLCLPRCISKYRKKSILVEGDSYLSVTSMYVDCSILTEYIDRYMDLEHEERNDFLGRMNKIFRVETHNGLPNKNSL